VKIIEEKFEDSEWVIRRRKSKIMK
jgi:hypothetical protein